jgi:hypothetical protein
MFEVVPGCQKYYIDKRDFVKPMGAKVPNI